MRHDILKKNVIKLLHNKKKKNDVGTYTYVYETSAIHIGIHCRMRKGKKYRVELTVITTVV